MDKKTIKVSQPILDQKEVDAVARIILQEGYLSMGREVKQFEEDVQAFLKTKREVVAVNTGTAALHLAVAAATKPGDEVLVQSLTYVASFQAISAAGAIPVSCEVDPETLCIDLEDAAKKITPRTRAIMPVHYAGDPANLQAIYDFAKEHNLRVIEDAAHAFGTTYNGKCIGDQGDIVCFSFDAIKNITAGEGGVVITHDKEVARYVRDARLLGVQGDTDQRFRHQTSNTFDVVGQGYRYHMNNIHAAIGRVQLQKFPAFKAARQNLAKRYIALLKGVEGIELFEKNYEQVVPHVFIIKVLGGKRDELKAYLESKGVEALVRYYPNHLLTYYKTENPLPVTEEAYSRILTLPLHPGLTEAQQDVIVEAIKSFFA